MPTGNLLKYWDPAGTPAGRVARTNLMNNPRAASAGSGGWSPTARWGIGGAGNHYYIGGTGGPSGTGIATCYRKIWTTAPTANVASGHEIRASTTTLFPCTPGDVLTVSIYMRISVSGTDKTAFPTIQFYDRTAVSGAVTVEFEKVGPTSTLTLGAWVRVSHTVTVPVGAAGFRLIAEIANSGGLWAVGNQLDVTGMMIEKAAALDTYFDGSSTDTASFDYDWVGTADNSSSTSDPWKSVISPAGATGPQGSAGTSQVRASAGGCSFAGSLASYTSGSGWVRIGSLKPITGFMDLNPCFTVKASGDYLTVARTGTIMISWDLFLVGGAVGNSATPSVMQIGDAPWLQRYSWPLVWEDCNSLSVILPNVAAGTDIPFWVNFSLNAASCPMNAFINAAWIQ